MTSQRLHTVCVVYIYSDFTSRLNLHYMFIKACDVKSLFTDYCCHEWRRETKRMQWPSCNAQTLFYKKRRKKNPNKTIYSESSERWPWKWVKMGVLSFSLYLCPSLSAFIYFYCCRHVWKCISLCGHAVTQLQKYKKSFSAPHATHVFSVNRKIILKK